MSAPKWNSYFTKKWRYFQGGLGAGGAAGLAAGAFGAGAAAGALGAKGAGGKGGKVCLCLLLHPQWPHYFQSVAYGEYGAGGSDYAYDGGKVCTILF